MKYFVPTILAFLLIMSCSDSDEPTVIPPEQFSLPTLTTASITDITDVSAISGGNITDDGGASVTARGVCWSTATGPTIADTKTSNASGIGEFSSTLEGLTPQTTYYVRSYATNSEGTAYGDEVSFSTLESEPIAKIFEGDVILNSQREIDEFGGEKYTEITGNLTIEDKSFLHIENLNSLNELIAVAGDLSILDNNDFDFKSLDGLSSLTTIGGKLLISGNVWLENINGLHNLSELKTLEIVNNGTLFFLNGLEKIKELNTLEVSGNGQLRDLDGLSQLNDVENAILIESNDALGNINGLEKLNSIGGGLEVSNNHILDDFCGLTMLITNEGIAGSYIVESNLYNPSQQDIINGNCSQ